MQRFHRRGSVAGSIRRIAVEEIDTALAAIRSETAAEAETIRIVRQQLKRLRALIRLARRHFDGFSDENAHFRDLARRLARTRDADVLRETFDGIAEDARGAFSGFRAPLLSRTEATTESRRPVLQTEIAAGLAAARRRAMHWQFSSGGFALVGPGLKRVYKDMRAAEALAAAHPTPDHFHEWRKQTKYHANQLALLASVAPKVFKGYRKIGERLATTLGNHHDLDALTSAVLRLDDAPPHDRRRLLAAIGRRNVKLEDRAFRLGDELTAERPDDFLRRIESGWKSWRK